MVTKEMVLAGLENNMVHVGAYTEGGVTQDLQKSIDELACSIGEYSFFFATGDEYESIFSVSRIQITMTVGTRWKSALKPDIVILMEIGYF